MGKFNLILFIPSKGVTSITTFTLVNNSSDGVSCCVEVVNGNVIMTVKFPAGNGDLFVWVSGEYAVISPAIRQVCEDKQDVMVQATDCVLVMDNIPMFVTRVLGASRKINDKNVNVRTQAQMSGLNSFDSAH